MKNPSLIAIALSLFLFSSGMAQPTSPGLPFGDLRFPGAKVDTLPAPRSMASPFDLCKQFQKKKLSGDAIIGFIISKEGKVENIKIVQSTSPEFAKLSVDYVSTLRFRPAVTNGAAVSCEVEMPFFFPVDKKPSHTANSKGTADTAAAKAPAASSAKP